MYPTTKFNIVDNSAIPSLPVEDASIYKVLEMIGFSSDQGPEGYRIVEGDEFFNLYGKNISFEKHGQPLLQAAMAINAGARLYCKRIVAEDAALANVGIVAVIENVHDIAEQRDKKADGKHGCADAIGERLAGNEQKRRDREHEGE